MSAEKRDTINIKVWMLRNGHTVESLRTELGYTNHTPVSLFIKGDRDTERVLLHLLEKGCPARYLGLPKSMEKAA